MKNLLLAILLVASVGLTACFPPPSHLGPAVIMVTNESQAVADATPRKLGRACGVNILNLISVGDISADAARRDGHITKIAEVDRDVKHFIVFSQVCTVVTGE